MSATPSARRAARTAERAFAPSSDEPDEADGPETLHGREHGPRETLRVRVPVPSAAAGGPGRGIVHMTRGDRRMRDAARGRTLASRAGGLRRRTGVGPRADGPVASHAEHDGRLRPRPSAAARKRTASATWSLSTSRAVARSAIVRATRSTRSTPRADSRCRSPRSTSRRSASRVRRGEPSQTAARQATRWAGPRCGRPGRPGRGPMRSRTTADASGSGAATRSALATRGIDAQRSTRSRNGPETRAAYRSGTPTRAAAAAVRVAGTAARARVHRGDELEPRREHHGPSGPCDRDPALLERLPEGLEDVPGELRQLVEEQHATVREGDLAGRRPGPTADDRGVRGRVVRGAERPASHEGRRAARGRRQTPRSTRRAPRPRRAPAAGWAPSARGASCRSPAVRPGRGSGRPRGRSRARVAPRPGRAPPRGPVRPDPTPPSPAAPDPDGSARTSPIHRVCARGPRCASSRTACGARAATSGSASAARPAPRARRGRRPRRPRGPGTRPASTSRPGGDRHPTLSASLEREGERAGSREPGGPRRRATARRSRPTTPARTTCSEPTRMPRAIAASSDDPALRMSGGARLTVMRRGGWTKPLLRSAPRTRSRASCRAASASPTIVKPGIPGATSTSTRMTRPARPTIVAESSVTSMPPTVSGPWSAGRCADAAVGSPADHRADHAAGGLSDGCVPSPAAGPPTSPASMASRELDDGAAERRLGLRVEDRARRC